MRIQEGEDHFLLLLQGESRWDKVIRWKVC